MAKRKKSKWWLIILLLLLLLAVIGYFFGKRNKKDIEKVTIDKSALHTINELVAANGKIFPITEVKISSDVSGEVVELMVNEGDSVVAGQVLAKINPESYVSAVARGKASLNSAKSQRVMSMSRVKSSEAQLEQIKVQLKNAERIHKRNTELKDQGVLSLADWESSLSNVEVLRANKKSAEANIFSAKEDVKANDYSVASSQASLREVKANLSKTTITAPLSGTISLLNVKQGERVVGTMQMAGTEMMRIANLNAMEVQVEVSENNILKVSVGDSVDVEVDAFYDRTFKGYVTQIANTASNANSSTTQSLSSTQVTNFVVKIQIDPSSYKDLLVNRRYVFRPGMSANVNIYTDRKADILTVPIQAVTAREIDEKVQEVVFVVKADTLQRHIVKTGIQDDKNIEILSGLEQGIDVVTGPYDVLAKKLKEGTAIEEKVKKEDEEK